MPHQSQRWPDKNDGCINLCTCERLTSTLITHLKAFKLANINKNPGADVKKWSQQDKGDATCGVHSVY